MPEKKPNGRHSGRPTLDDVARLADCSPMTASRVINGGSGVREHTRLAVETAIRQLNYAPNRAARSLAGAGQTRVALLYTNPSAAYLSELLIGCMDQASQMDAHVIIERCEAGQEEKLINRLVAGGIDGFLLPPPLCDETDLLELIRRQRIHAVLIGPGRADAHYGAVMIDDYQAAYDMTRHIIAHGHRRIGFIIGNPHQSVSALRCYGFRDAMHGADLPVDEALVRQGLFTYRSGMDAASAMLDLADPPTAIFASNDDMAAGCIAAAHRKRLVVPGQLTVCGFDDTANASMLWPELTTIRQPIRDMASCALTMLTGSIHAGRAGDPLKAKHATLDYSLIQRDSDAPPGAA